MDGESNSEVDLKKTKAYDRGNVESSSQRSKIRGCGVGERQRLVTRCRQHHHRLHFHLETERKDSADAAGDRWCQRETAVFGDDRCNPDYQIWMDGPSFQLGLQSSRTPANPQAHLEP
ncbi:hypothetical protein L1987_79639 [Smallanthus sonchifolius]|uniref:Uncharacterized protein n=1 Tax=Smallanthus sonchifolius TaxID=185202 RepID=A0ACB8YKG2_9ASTR|nr:hypothetical protein L1987_79639 [Smallanthus sonchifolius]